MIHLGDTPLFIAADVIGPAANSKVTQTPFMADNSAIDESGKRSFKAIKMTPKARATAPTQICIMMDPATAAQPQPPSGGGRPSDSALVAFKQIETTQL